jgi:hypothetical protein
LKTSTAKDGKHTRSKSKSAGLSDRQLMAALRRANPEKYAAVTTAPKSPNDQAATKNRTEREDRALAEVMEAAGCTVGSKDHIDPVQRARDVKKMFCEAAGIRNEAIAGHLLAQIAGAINHGQLITEFERLTGAIAVMREIQPANVHEAMLAAQMVAVHHAAMKFMHLSTLPGQTLEGIKVSANLAIRMMRMYSGQLKILAKLRGQTGQQLAVPQRAAVEQHVTVQDGGQAIVSAVITPDPAAGRKGILRFDFKGEFQTTRRQVFNLLTAEGTIGTIELIPGPAFNLLEVNFQTEAKAGKVRQADVVLVKK